MTIRTFAEKNYYIIECNYFFPGNKPINGYHRNYGGAFYKDDEDKSCYTTFIIAVIKG
jgi:hypothetical protein